MFLLVTLPSSSWNLEERSERMQSCATLIRDLGAIDVQFHKTKTYLLVRIPNSLELFQLIQYVKDVGSVEILTPYWVKRLESNFMDEILLDPTAT